MHRNSVEDHKLEALRRTPLFRRLQEKELQALCAIAIDRQVQRGEILFMAGDDARGIYVIVSGLVRAVRLSADGREQVIHTEQAGATIGELPVFDGGRYPSTVIADQDSHLLFIDKQDVRRLFLEYPTIALEALSVLSQRLRQCAELIEFLSLREVGQRIARLLVLEARKNGQSNGKGIQITLHLTNQQIAAQVGSVREVVSRAIARLQKEHLVVFQGRSVFIPDLEALASYADFS